MWLNKAIYDNALQTHEVEVIGVDRSEHENISSIDITPLLVTIRYDTI